jgi:hypothetical protein
MLISVAFVHTKEAKIVLSKSWFANLRAVTGRRMALSLGELKGLAVMEGWKPTGSVLTERRSHIKRSTS